jgi:hypothetical protein
MTEKQRQEYLKRKGIRVPVLRLGRHRRQLRRDRWRYSGSDCLNASKRLEVALGVATAEQKSAEYYTSTTAQQEIAQ